MTAQVPDTLTLDGADHALYSEPSPIGPPVLAGSEITFWKPATAFYRGYVARWEVRDRRLLLTGLIARVVDGQRNAASSSRFDLAQSAFYYSHRELPGRPTWIQWDYFVSGYFPDDPDGFATFELGLADLYGSDTPVPATWVNEPLYVPWGEMVGEYLIARYRYAPSRFRRLLVERGEIVSDRIVANRSEQPFPPRGRQRR